MSKLLITNHITTYWYLVVITASYLLLSNSSYNCFLTTLKDKYYNYFS